MRLALLMISALLVPHAASAQWTVHTNVDDFTGERSSYATVQGRGGEYRAGLLPRPYLGLQCDSRGPVIYFETSTTFLDSGGDLVNVLLKVDDKKTREFWFTANAEGTGARLVGDLERDEFWQVVSDMRAGGTAKLRATDYRGASYDYEFPLTGVTKATNAMDCWDREAKLARLEAMQAEAERQRRKAEAREDSIARAAEERGRVLDAEVLASLEVGDTVIICNSLDPGKAVRGLQGHPNSRTTYLVQRSRNCDRSQSRLAKGEVRRIEEDETGAPWVFTKLFDPYYNAWIQPRYMRPVARRNGG